MATLSTTLYSTLNHPKPTHHHIPSSSSSSSSSFDHVKLPYTKLRLSIACHGIEAIFTRRRRAHRVIAAVAQEEAVEVVGEEEEKQVEGGVEEGNGGVVVVQGGNTKLYVGNLPYNCDSATLAGLVQQYAEPELVEVLYDRVTGKSKGFAFVTMSTIEDCNKVIENLDNSELGGRYLIVNFSDKPKPKEPFFPETGYKLFIGNLAWSVTSESLRQAFGEYGNVVGARVVFDGETGGSRGFGFVSYATKQEMEKALEALNGQELEGRAIRVSLAEGKKLRN